MLEYRRVGELMGGDRDLPLLLPADRPLSYLRVEENEGTRTLARALLDRQATEFRRRVALVRPRDGGLDELLGALRRFGVSTVFPRLGGSDSANGSALDVCWLDRVQLLTVARDLGCDLQPRQAAVAVDGLSLTPTYAAGPAGEAGPVERVDSGWQYWNSLWNFEDPPEGSKSWWRVRPNRNRKPEGAFGLSRPAARGTSAARLAPAALEKLGNPRYLVIEHPFRGGRLAVLALEEKEVEGLDRERGETAERDTVYLDRTARDALGISDGEFCLVHPWLSPRHAVWRRRMRDRFVGSRAISANVRTSARADLEKPVCRLDEETLAAIGGRPGEFVTLESLRRDTGPEGTRIGRWERVRMSQRVIPIDDGERGRRSAWEAAQPWDEGSASPGAWSRRRRPGLEHEGFVDCAETLGVHPPYPTVYLNFNAREELALELCQPVEIRVSVVGRVLSDLGNLAWLVLIGLIGTVAALLELSIGLIAAILGVTLLALLIIRAIRTIR